MTDFRRVTDSFWASPQITIEDVGVAGERGVAMIVNNRPEDESGDQTPGRDIQAAADAAGIDYREIPVTHAGFSEEQVRAMAAALEQAGGPVLAYCRSGTRSTLLWALARASQGGDPGTIASEAAAAGYDVAPIRQIIDLLAARSRS
jgi:uncharacterized protein (TIGR01244 family)